MTRSSRMKQVNLYRTSLTDVISYHCPTVLFRTNLAFNVEEHKQEDIRINGSCCFNHIIGLPQKDATDKPLYDYQRMIFDSLVDKDGNVNPSSKQG
jgi:hypothetical protein